MWSCIRHALMLCSFWVWVHFIFQMNSCMVWFHGMLTILLIPVVRVWRMLCEHVVKVSRLARFLFIEKVTMASRFALISLPPLLPFHCIGSCAHIFMPFLKKIYSIFPIVLLDSLSAEQLFVWSCWTANLWKATQWYLREACIAVGSNLGNRYFCFIICCQYIWTVNAAYQVC